MMRTIHLLSCCPRILEGTEDGGWPQRVQLGLAHRIAPDAQSVIGAKSPARGARAPKRAARAARWR